VWIPTKAGAVNSRYVIQIIRDADGCILHMVDGTTVRSAMMFGISDDGRLRPLPDLDDDSDVPF